MCCIARLVPLALALVVGAARAQFYVVDAADRPGTDFTSIATAVAQVPDGATLLVRAGQYAAFTIDGKSLTVLGDRAPPASFVLVDPPGVEIRNVPAGEQVTLRQIEVLASGPTPEFRCLGNTGTVLLDHCYGSYFGFGIGGRVVVTDCADLRMTKCVIDTPEGTPLLVTDSHVRIHDSWLATMPVGVPSCRVVDSTVEVVGVEVLGNGAAPDQAPFHLTASALRVLGGSILRNQTVAGPVVTGTGTLRIDPDTTILNGTASPFGPGIVVTSRTMPAVDATTAGPFGLATAVLTGPANGIAALWLGLPGPPTFVAPFEDAIVILPGSEFVQAMGDLTAPLSASYVVPPLPLLLGVRVTWQGASIDAQHGVQIGNGVTYVHF